MKKGRIKKIILLIVIAAVIVGGVLRVKHNQRLTGSAEIPLETNELVRGADGSMNGSFSGLYYMNVNKTGIFYMEEYRMYYLDYESGQSYVLCDKVNCKHTSSSCGGYASGLFGLAAYNGYLYAFAENEAKNTYDLTRMSMNGQDRKVIASLDIGEYEAGKWCLTPNFYNIYYGYERAYVPVEYRYIYPEEGYGNGLSRLQLLTIDLDTGDITVLTESEGMDLYHSLDFELISQDKVIITRKENPDALIGRELEQAIASGEVAGLQEMLDEIPEEDRAEYWQDDLYMFYGEYAVYRMTEMRFSLEMYDFSSEKNTTLWSGNCEYIYDEDGQIQSWQTPYNCLGWYEDGFITQTYEYEMEKGQIIRPLTIKKWDFSGGDGETLLEVSNGAVPIMSFGTVGNYVLDDGKIIYMEYLDDGKNGQLYYYDPEAGQSVPLYQDVRDITFRFLGETEGYFIGDMITGDDHDAYIIAKDDYYAGNLDAAKWLLNDK